MERDFSLIDGPNLPDWTGLGLPGTAYANVLTADAGAVTVQVRLLFRRAFIDLMVQKGWDLADIQLAEGIIILPES